MKKIFAIVLAAALLAVGLPASAEPDLTFAGEDVSAFSSELIDGTPVDGSVFGEYRVSAVTYWATWSANCRAQMAILQDIHDQHPDFGVMGLLYVDGTSTAAAASEFMAENGYTFPVFTCDEVWTGIVERSFFLPQTFIISRTGIILEGWTASFSSPSELETRLVFWDGAVPWSGDVDRNGALEPVDALMALRMALGLIEYDEADVLCADLNLDGVLNTEDALLIIRRALGII